MHKFFMLLFSPSSKVKSDRPEEIEIEGGETPIECIGTSQSNVHGSEFWLLEIVIVFGA